MTGGPGFLARFILLGWTALAVWGQPSVMQGYVLDASTGEKLARVKLVVSCGGQETESYSGADGGYLVTVRGLDCGLMASLVGYRPLRAEVQAGAADLLLTPDQLTRTDRLEVSAGPFESVLQSSPAERRLSTQELKNLSGVIADDPLRAVQSLPGVAANDEYSGIFSLRGAGFERLAVYADGILLNNPLHSVPTQTNLGSTAMFPTDVVQEVLLHPGAPPVRYQEFTSGVLDLRLREGNRRSQAFRVNAGVAAINAVAEGPLAGGRGSWLASVRKSYLQYLIRESSAAEAGLAFGFLDAQAKVSYELSPRHQLSLTFLDGLSDLDRRSVLDRLGINAITTATYHFTVGSLGWRWSPSARAALVQRGSWMRERYAGENPQRLPLGLGGYTEWAGVSEAHWQWSSRTPLSAGVQIRRIHDDGNSFRWQFNPAALRRADQWNATGLRSGGWLEQGWQAGRLWGSTGVRWDASTVTAPIALLPHGSVALRLWEGGKLVGAFSQAAQYPEMPALFTTGVGNPHLPPARAQHGAAGVEQMLGQRARLRVEWWRRDERDLWWQPQLEPRLNAAGATVTPPLNPTFESSLRGSSHGYEILLERRSANRISGWVAYAWGKASMRDSVLGKEFDADSDQRHTLNAYGAWRLRSQWMLSLRYSYGSNFPIPGFVRRGPDGRLYLAQERNRIRLDAYQRADFRVTRSFQRKTWRATLYAEVLNLTNRRNRRFDSYDGFNARTGQVFMTFSRLFPILPAAGISFEWDTALRR
jgi:hypothetical protein